MKTVTAAVLFALTFLRCFPAVRRIEQTKASNLRIQSMLMEKAEILLRVHMKDFLSCPIFQKFMKECPAMKLRSV